LKERGYDTKKLYKKDGHDGKNVFEYLHNGKIDFIFNAPKDESKKEDTF
tara:strand:+ start:471 stop:617 length:147 start_codon:yes stop_codon:yes gene_type:complete